jgi:glycosyltransferase involved in cell wall biosynthesis
MPATIAYLTSVYPRATDTFVRNEVLRLRERGWTVRTFAVRRAEPSQLVGDEIRREASTTTYIVSDHLWETPLAVLRLLFRSPRRFLRAARLAWRTHPRGLQGSLWQLAYFAEAAYLAHELRRAGARHLHNHIGESSATVAMLASELGGVPFSLTIHGPYDFQAPARWALGEKLARAAFTACISEFTRSQCMIHAPLACWDRLHVVRCGPDPAFLEAEPPPLPSRPRLVWVGRICEEKGVTVLLEAARRLVADGVDFDLVLVGDGPLRGAIERRIEADRIGNRVSITGWLDGAGVREQLAASRVLVMPSFAEGLPVVLMEALALGRPVISTFVAGIPELVQPGVNGWLVPAGSVAALVAAMRDALQTPLDRLERMGRAGREAVRRQHDPRAEVARLAELLAAAIGDGAPIAGSR